MQRPRVLVTRLLPASPDAVLGPDADVDVFEHDRAPTRAELIDRGRDADALVTLLSDAIDGGVLDACPRVRVVANVAVGYDNVDVPAATARGVVVTNTPDVLTEATADLTWALILAAARRVVEGDRMVRDGAFHGWSPTMLLGMELGGRTLGILGFGRIGQAVARRAPGFGMRVVFSSRSEVPAAVRERLGATQVDRDALFEQSDVLSVHCPLNAETHHAVADAQLARMKPDALVINTARGPIVDEAALVRALERGALGGAGLDVYEEEPRVHPGLMRRSDVVLLPHLGSATRDTRRRMAELALGNVAAILRGDPPITPLNAPSEAERAGRSRPSGAH